MDTLMSRHSLGTEQVTELPSSYVWRFGKPHDWSLDGITEQIDVQNESKKQVITNLKKLAEKTGIQRIMIPSLHRATAVSATIQNFRTSIDIQPNLEILRGCTADGVIIPDTKSGVLMRSADCPTIILWSSQSNFVMVGHGGRDSLLPRNYIVHRKMDRKYPSIVDSMIKCAECYWEDVKEMNVYITTGIRAVHFNHPWNHKTFGLYNRSMFNYVMFRWGNYANIFTGRSKDGLLNLTELIKAQFIERDIPHKNIDSDTGSIDTFGDYDKEMNPLWWSARRNPNSFGRNAILVVKK